jgi:hypothetical protein
MYKLNPGIAYPMEINVGCVYKRDLQNLLTEVMARAYLQDSSNDLSIAASAMDWIATSVLSDRVILTEDVAPHKLVNLRSTLAGIFIPDVKEVITQPAYSVSGGMDGMDEWDLSVYTDMRDMYSSFPYYRMCSLLSHGMVVHTPEVVAYDVILLAWERQSLLSFLIDRDHPLIHNVQKLTVDVLDVGSMWTANGKGKSGIDSFSDLYSMLEGGLSNSRQHFHQSFWEKGCMVVPNEYATFQNITKRSFK